MNRPAYQRNLVLVHGKGGVGKTAISRSLALRSAHSGVKTLWVCFEDPRRPAGETKQADPLLFELNCETMRAFEEYAGILIGIPAISRIFVRNRLIRYLVQAAPGMREIVLLGKVWHERTQFERVIVDMPSTGHALAMIKSTGNYSKLFRGGPVHRDSLKMFKTFDEAETVGHLIVSLPEEMPLQESLEFAAELKKTLPNNPPEYILNREFPESSGDSSIDPDPQKWPSPLAKNNAEYRIKRTLLEKNNLEIWKRAGVCGIHFPYLPPRSNEKEIAQDLVSHWPDSKEST